MTVLDDLAAKSRTTKMWVDGFIKPVLTMMLYVRAERSGDWPLHLQAVKLMMPYFFASSHINYARYGLYYLRSMEALPENVLQHFMKGAHVMRHISGLWNGRKTKQFFGDYCKILNYVAPNYSTDIFVLRFTLHY